VSLRDPIARMASELSPETRRRRLALYVALGDSFTAGTGCAPGEAWPDRLASALRPHNPGLGLRNLAVQGATSAQVLAQLPEAIELEPDLVTVVCGANDVLRSTRPDPDRYAGALARILTGLREAVPGVRIVTATAPERWEFLGLGPRTRERVEVAIGEFNGVTRRLATRLEIPCLDVSDDPGLGEPANFCADGLHPSPRGHERAARGFAMLLQRELGIESDHHPEHRADDEPLEP
jgi:lysophospholipase L1-like esterase